MSYKMEQRDAHIADAVSNGCSALLELGEECREIVDNASEGLANTQRIQTLEETASALEYVEEPEISDPNIEGLRVKYMESTNKDRRRGCSRAVRRDNAVAMLNGAIAVLEEKIDEWGDNDAPGFVASKETAEELRDQLQQIVDEAEGVEFPGMYGG